MNIWRAFGWANLDCARMALIAAAGALLVGFPYAARAQDPCAQLRAPTMQPLLGALSDRKEGDIRKALADLAATPAFAVPTDPVEGRRPYRESYAIQLTDNQLERRVRNFYGQIERRTRRVRSPIVLRRGQAAPLSEAGDAIRDLLAIAQGFPKWEKRARKLAREIGDQVIQISATTAFPAVPLSPQGNEQPQRLYLRTSLEAALKTCPSLRSGLRNGWFVAPVTPEMHYAETSLVGEAMLRLARDTGEIRFLAWARAASGWLTSRPIAADVTANVLMAGFDAELFILTAEKKYLERAIDWATYGVLPAFAPVPESVGQDRATVPIETQFFSRLGLGDLARTTRALVHLSTAVAAAPLDALSETQTRGIYLATDQAYALLQRRAIQQRRLQFPADLIEIALDIERAQLAGAVLSDPDPVALKHALAHGVDRAQRFIRLPGAASGRLLQKLQMRGWAGAFRPPKPPEQKAQKASD